MPRITLYGCVCNLPLPGCVCHGSPSEILTKGFPELTTVTLANDPAHLSKDVRALLPRIQRTPERYATFTLTQFEVQLDMSLDELCEKYEVQPCLGKKWRRFHIPASVVNKCAQLRVVRLGTRPEVLWNEYLSRRIESQTGWDARLRIVIVGDPRHLGTVPEIVETLSGELRVNDRVQNGDAVLFCMSVTDGPMPGTVETLQLCCERTIVPLAVVLTDFELVDDESLYSLVTSEHRELLIRILPAKSIDDMPALIAGDPYFLDKLQAVISSNPMAVRCSGERQ